MGLRVLKGRYNVTDLMFTVSLIKYRLLVRHEALNYQRLKVPPVK